jgi:hypothetical protein
MAYYEEIGNLDEANFNGTLQGELQRSDVAEDAHARFWDMAVDWNDDEMDPVTVDASSELVHISLKDRWMTIKGMEHTFVSRGGTLAICASMQVRRKRDNTETNTLISNTYAQYGIFVDGALITESAIGAFDTSTDFENMEMGMEGYLYAPKLEVESFPITPGGHHVAIRVKLLGGPRKYSAHPDDTTHSAAVVYERKSVHIGSRMMSILEES